MPKNLEPHSFYFYGTPTGMGPSLTLATGIGEVIGQLITLPFKTPFYVAAFVKKLRSHPIIQETVDTLSIKEQQEEIRQSLYKLKNRKLITYTFTKNGVVELHLTSKGKKYFSKLKLKKLRIKPPTQWDGKWRMLIFDIPEKQRLIRDLLRQRLKQMVFFQIQQSVWIHPFECEEEIRLLSQYYKLEKYILLYTIAIENDEKLRAYFKLKGAKK